MSKIEVKKPTDQELKELNVDSWSPWECAPSTFDWEYTDKETCYILDGKVKVKTEDGEVEVKKGDLVTFPKGLKCVWNVEEKIQKVYKFG